jgi:hypothetical protein
MNKGRMNLAEELGRIDARSNPNAKAYGKNS